MRRILHLRPTGTFPCRGRVSSSDSSWGSGWWSVFSETAHVVLNAIRNGLIVDSHTIPDISVGLAWMIALLAHATAFVRWFAANRFFDAVQCPDPFQRFPRHRRRVRLFQIVEVAPHMRPTGGMLDAAVL